MLLTVILSLCLVSSVTSYFQGSNSFSYGTHYPDGVNVATYMTGPAGPWKKIDQLQYIWNYYQQFATANHPFDKEALISYANGPTTTARDANGYLLWDRNHDNEVDNSTSYGYAFCEHSGSRWIGDNQNTRGQFTNFWFDDNTLANYMTLALGIQSPSGLSSQPGYVRWQIISGDNTNWTPYSGTGYPDTLSLNGLYYLSKGDMNSAISTWYQLINLAAPQWDQNNQQYNYTALTDLYYLGLVKTFTDFLALATNDVSGTMTQHSVSLRSVILSAIQTKQQYGNHLINTETMSSWILGLGAGAYAVYESETALQHNDGPYFYRPYHALSAVTGISSKGYMSFGPYASLPLGTYSVDFYLRAHQPTGTVVTIEVHDAHSDVILAQSDVPSTSFTSDLWSVVSVQFLVNDSSHVYEFRTYWQGNCNVDLASVRVRVVGFAAPPAPITTQALTTAQACAPLTTAPVTSAPLTSAAVTSSPLSTSPITSAKLTTSPVTSGRLTTHAPVFTCPSRQSGNGIGYYCDSKGTGFIECWAGNSYNFQCPAGTGCRCGYGVECSRGGTRSPCTF